MSRHFISVTDHDIANESNEFERIRLVNIKRNQEVLAQLGSYPSLLTENEGTTKLIEQKRCDDSDSEGCNDSVAEESSQASLSALDSESDLEDVSYEPVEAFSETVKFPTPKKMSLLNSPREDYWSYVDRVFRDLQDGKLYTIDFVVRAEPFGWYLFEYVELDATGKRVVDDAEEQRTACHEMVSKDCDWIEWREVMKKSS